MVMPELPSPNFHLAGKRKLLDIDYNLANAIERLLECNELLFCVTLMLLLVYIICVKHII